MSRNQMKVMMKGAFVLTIASFIAKLLSAVYRVPFQNLVGDEGFYVYQQVYPIYGIAMTLALSGLPQFISKIVVSYKDSEERQTVLHQLYAQVLRWSLLLWALIFFGSGWMALLMGDERLHTLIQVVSFAFLLVPPLSFYRGYFQGQLLMVPSAVSQVCEQFVRVGIILIAAMCYRWFELNIYHVGTLAMAGAFVGGLVAWWLLVRYDFKIFGVSKRFTRKKPKSQLLPQLRRRLLVEGGLLSIYSGLLIGFQLLDSFFVIHALEISGVATHAARVAKGVYDRGQPLVQLGLVVATAFSATFLPVLTEARVGNKKDLFLTTAKIYLRVTVSLSAAAACGLAFLIPWLNITLFKDNAGRGTLMLFVLAIALTATIQSYQNIAQSKNHFRRSLKAAGWGLLAKLVTTSILTMSFQTRGTSLSTLLGLLVILFYFIYHEEKAVNQFWIERQFIFKLVGCLLGMVIGMALIFAVVGFFVGPITHRSGTLCMSLFGVAIGAGVFVSLAVRCRLLTVREWLMLPFGKKILRFIGGK